MSREPHWIPRYPRTLNRIYAFLFGYFWRPCPLCGFRYGGHEREPGLGVCFNHTSAELRKLRGQS